jgi:outer membrane lipase/esterase
MSKLRHALVASAAALACVAGPAPAQFSGFVFFGDSLTDAGSYAPALPPGTGRFTTNPDPVWAQVIGARNGFVITPANQGGTDYAQGGARVVLLPGVPPTNPLTAAALPIAQQVTQAIGAGVNAGALYSLWGGANDVLFQLGLVQAGAITADQAQAAVVQAAQQYVQQVAALQAAGVQNIAVLNLPDIGRTPFGIAAGPAGSAQITAITNLYNATVQAGLNALGGNVARVDINALFAELLANPSAYGLTNVTTPACGTTNALVCTRANLVAPNADRTFLFADGVHPTGVVHEFVAAFVSSILEAPSLASTLTEGPLAVEQATFRTVDGRMWSALDTPMSQKGFNLWVSYDYANPDIDRGPTSGDADLHTVSVGGDLRVTDHLLAGAAVNFSEYKANYTNGGHKLEETSATIYAGYGTGAWYVGTSILIGDLDYKDVRRTFDVGGFQRSEGADAGGSHWAVRVLGGYWLKAGNALHGPFAKLVYQEADVDAFSERTGTATALRYGEQKRESLISSLGWQVQGQWGAVRPFGRITWEYEFKDGLPSVSATPLNIGGTFSTALHKPDDNWALINVGASMDFGTRTATSGPVSAYLMGTATGGKDDGDSYAITLGIRVPL